MRKAFFDAASKFEPFTDLYGSGAKPEQIKEAIILLLDPYVKDKPDLRKFAISALASEAISIARLSSRNDWKDLFVHCLDVRERAIRADEKRAFGVMQFFEKSIREAQKNFALATIFEIPKEELNLDEFAFEIFRTIGVLTESNIQIYIKEFHCLNEISLGEPVDCDIVSNADFGAICEQLEKALPDILLTRPKPWLIRLNQWRNIAQHTSYTIAENSIVADYGKSSPRKSVSMTRGDLLALAQELMVRLGALKSSREITFFNYLDQVGSYITPAVEIPYNKATMLVASFGTQGFRLTDLQVTEQDAIACLEDMSPSEGVERPVHCSQFIATISSYFPNRAVQIRYFANDRHLWTFQAKTEDLQMVMALDDPLLELAHIVQFKKELPLP